MSDTIFALSSGSGIAGVAVVRVSGPGSRSVLREIAGTLPQMRVATLATLRDPACGEALDKGLVLWFPAPASFTGEDCAEFHVHGGHGVVAALLRVLAVRPGLRLAEAGEFSLRALKNGKLDLPQAEGLADLLGARTERQRAQAVHQLLGRSSNEFEKWRQALVELLARAETAIDFVDEDGVAPAAFAEIRPRAEKLRIRMISAIGAAAAAARIRDGFRIVLAGAPNVGKSSLLNRLVQRDAAIVSAIPGTTRDAIEADLILGGVPVVATDTAGLRSAGRDEIEIEGMARSRKWIAEADIVLWVSAPDIPGSELGPELDSAAIWIENKCDLNSDNSIHNRNEPETMPDYRVSALTGEGIAGLLSGLEERATKLLTGAESAIVVRERQRIAVEKVIDAVGSALSAEARELEIVAEHLRRAADELGRLTGRIGIEDVLDAVFRDFCVGK
jgi:tRNA modification GTPase